MTLETVPILREDSIICWDKETTRGVAPGTSPWQSLGRVEDWEDIGPTFGVYREAIAGSGREAATISANGVAYGPASLGPFQIVDPRFLGHAWGQELSAPLPLGNGYYRHTCIPTRNGALSSFSLQMADYKNGVRVDGSTYLNTIMPKLSIRGEEVAEDGTGGRILAVPTVVAHDESITVPAKPVTLPNSDPYRAAHASLSFFGTDKDWRIHSWEFSMDSNASTNYYHNNTYAGKPTETPPEGLLYDASFDIIADGHTNGGAILRDIIRNKTVGSGQIKYIRTVDKDEWAINLTDILIMRGPKRRSKGKVHYDLQTYVRASTFEWVDANPSRYFPA